MRKMTEDRVLELVKDVFKRGYSEAKRRVVHNFLTEDALSEVEIGKRCISTLFGMTNNTRFVIGAGGNGLLLGERC
jgi:hypothetical protein